MFPNHGLYGINLVCFVEKFSLCLLNYFYGTVKFHYCIDVESVTYFFADRLRNTFRKFRQYHRTRMSCRNCRSFCWLT